MSDITDQLRQAAARMNTLRRDERRRMIATTAGLGPSNADWDVYDAELARVREQAVEIERLRADLRDAQNHIQRLLPLRAERDALRDQLEQSQAGLLNKDLELEETIAALRKDAERLRECLRMVRPYVYGYERILYIGAVLANEVKGD